MLFQLGNKQYDGMFTPESWSYSGNAANLAQYPLINNKPRLQHTGETLETVSLSFKLRLEYCYPNQEIKDLEQWKKEGTVLPLLLGNGEYVNDYVLQSVEKDIVQTLTDGTIVEANVSLTLIEFVPYSEEEKQADADRRNAAAVGDKQQINRRPRQKPTSEAQAHKALMVSINKSGEAANAANELKQAQNPESKIDKVKGIIKRAQEAMDNTRQKVSDLQEKINNATGIIAAANNAQDKLTEMSNLLQTPISTQVLNNAILNLQSGLRGLDSSATIFTTNIILRKQ